MAEVAGSNPADPSFFLESATLEPSIEAFSNTKIMAKKKHNKDKKLHNFNEKFATLTSSIYPGKKRLTFTRKMIRFSMENNKSVYQ
jgi:hypothetical protein